ncbi:MAG: LamG domain-containing protein [Patescibacteria group bacterium]
MKKNISILIKSILIIFAIGLFAYGVYATGFIFSPDKQTAQVNSLQKGLVGHWTLDEADYNSSTERVTDKTPYENHGTNNGAIPTVGKNGESGGAMSFYGNDYIQIADSNVLDNTSELTISLWIYLASAPAGYATHPIRKWGGTTDANYVMYIFGSNRTLQFYANRGGVWGGISSGYVLPLNAWHHITLVYTSTIGGQLYVDGVPYGGLGTSGVLATNSSPFYIGEADFDGKIDDVRIYNRALSSTEITQLYETSNTKLTTSSLQRGLVLDMPLTEKYTKSERTNHQIIANKTPYDDGKNFGATFNSGIGMLFGDTLESIIINYRTWKEGQTGSVGIFGQNGSTSENYRIIDTDPWGRPAVVWEARADAVSGADGGWNTSNFAIDQTKMYRFSTWIRRTVLGNGTYYMGVYGKNSAGTNIGVLNRSNGAVNTNPYFRATSGTEILSTSSWFLLVAHVWPEGSGTGSVYTDTGLYNTSGNKIATPIDFVWQGGTSLGIHRTYLYYSTNTDTRQQWIYPRVDIIDGTEPSIQDLLDGYDSYGNVVEVTLEGDKESVSFWYSDDTSGGWVHVVNSSGTYYVNGELGTPAKYPIVISGDYISIGKTAVSDFFDGEISNVKIYNRTLSADEVGLLYDLGRQ